MYVSLQLGKNNITKQFLNESQKHEWMSQSFSYDQQLYCILKSDFILL